MQNDVSFANEVKAICHKLGFEKATTHPYLEEEGCAADPGVVDHLDKNNDDIWLKAVAELTKSLNSQPGLKAEFDLNVDCFIHVTRSTVH